MVCESIVVSKGTTTLITDIWFKPSMSALMVCKDSSCEECLATQMTHMGLDTIMGTLVICQVSGLRVRFTTYVTLIRPDAKM